MALPQERFYIEEDYENLPENIHAEWNRAISMKILFGICAILDLRPYIRLEMRVGYWVQNRIWDSNGGSGMCRNRGEVKNLAVKNKGKGGAAKNVGQSSVGKNAEQSYEVKNVGKSSAAKKIVVKKIVEYIELRLINDRENDLSDRFSTDEFPPDKRLAGGFLADKCLVDKSLADEFSVDKFPPDKFSLDKIAKELNYSKFYMERVFSEITGMTICKYIWERRLTAAAEQLVRTKRPVIEIAYEAGYGSPQAFTQAFRRLYLCPPMIYRKNGVFVPKQTKITLSGMPCRGGEMIKQYAPSIKGYVLSSAERWAA